MIVLRQKEKEFSRRTLPPKGFLNIPEDWKENSEGIDIDIEKNQKLYEEAIRVLGPINKQIIKRYLKDIKEGYILDNNPIHKGKDDTHRLEDYSGENFITMTKSITAIDRLVYRVYKPILDRINKKIVIKIVVCSYLGHQDPINKLKSYSENGE